MIDPEIQKLLALQEFDTRLIRLNADLGALPVQRHKLKVEIELLETRIEEERQGIRSLEIRRKELENEVGSLEEKVDKYKKQQVFVKKNEEYQALTREIETTMEKIGEAEEQEIALMLQIDEKEEEFQKQKKEWDAEISRVKREIERLAQHEQELLSVKDTAEMEVEAAREQVSAPFLAAYDQAKRNLRGRPPFVAPIENGICRRSNLRVSNDLVKSAREHGHPHFDDATGCVVYCD